MLKRDRTGNSLDALSGYRNIVAVVSALTILQAAMAAVSIIVALTLSEAGVPNAAVGFVAASFAGGFLLGTHFSPREVRRIGHIRAYALFAAAAAIATLSFALGVDPIGWAAVQGVLGVCCAALLTAGESWIADAAPQSQRGAILSFYHMVSKLGTVAGPFLILAAHSMHGGLMLIAALFAASLIPVSGTNRIPPVLTAAEHFGPRQSLKHAPASAFAAFTAGAVNNSVAQLYPLFAAHVAPEGGPGFAANFNAALLAGAMLALWPAGRLSDRMDRRYVILGLAVIGAAAALGLVVFSALEARSALLASAFLFGGGSLSYYAIAVAHAADRSTPEQATSMMAGILLIWGIGSVAGPAIAGVIMNLGPGAPGLFIFAGIALALLAVSMLSRTVRIAPVPAGEKEPFGVAPATSLAIAEFDPRGDDTQFDLFHETGQTP